MIDGLLNPVVEDVEIFLRNVEEKIATSVRGSGRYDHLVRHDTNLIFRRRRGSLSLASRRTNERRAKRHYNYAANREFAGLFHGWLWDSVSTSRVATRQPAA
jgi:hypothetical protein